MDAFIEKNNVGFQKDLGILKRSCEERFLGATINREVVSLGALRDRITGRYEKEFEAKTSTGFEKQSE
ncbi:unnamed protein product [Strongylus vulgaris]|uniref:Uncharacterized protein n=1 Tax=Strongylus vulgaris TaxID=40348 RepID=A0A3P7LFZ2_STRVU|nr:unnamed protein product [Strongylus vulgaris]